MRWRRPHDHLDHNRVDTRKVPFVAHWVALLNPDTGQYVPLVIDGLDERSRRHLEGSTVISDLELARLPRMRRPVCLWDAPVPLQGMPTWADYF